MNLVLPYVYSGLGTWERQESPVLGVYVAICRWVARGVGETPAGFRGFSHPSGPRPGTRAQPCSPPSPPQELAAEDGGAGDAVLPLAEPQGRAFRGQGQWAGSRRCVWGTGAALPQSPGQDPVAWRENKGLEREEFPLQMELYSAEDLALMLSPVLETLQGGLVPCPAATQPGSRQDTVAEHHGPGTQGAGDPESRWDRCQLWGHRGLGVRGPHRSNKAQGGPEGAFLLLSLMLPCPCAPVLGDIGGAGAVPLRGDGLHLHPAGHPPWGAALEVTTPCGLHQL